MHRTGFRNKYLKNNNKGKYTKQKKLLYLTSKKIEERILQ